MSSSISCIFFNLYLSITSCVSYCSKNIPGGQVYVFNDDKHRTPYTLMFRITAPSSFQSDRGIQYVYKLAGAPGARNVAASLLREDIPVIMPWVMNGFECNGKILSHPSHWIPHLLDQAKPEEVVKDDAFADDDDLLAAAVAYDTFVPAALAAVTKPSSSEQKE